MAGQSHRIGKPTWIVLAFGVGACWYAAEHWNTSPAAKPAPAKVVVIHETVTKVAHAAGGLNWPEALVAIVALGILCAVMFGRRG
jgi:hypothetical protein